MCVDHHLPPHYRLNWRLRGRSWSVLSCLLLPLPLQTMMQRWLIYLGTVTYAEGSFFHLIHRRSRQSVAEYGDVVGVVDATHHWQQLRRNKKSNRLLNHIMLLHPCSDVTSGRRSRALCGVVGPDGLSLQLGSPQIGSLQMCIPRMRSLEQLKSPKQDRGPHRWNLYPPTVSP